MCMLEYIYFPSPQVGTGDGQRGVTAKVLMQLTWDSPQLS